MSDQGVVIVDTGCANVASVSAALGRLGATSRVSDDPAMVRSARLVVLPGVGAFGAAMERLRARGLDEAVAGRVREERPLLAICLGMQLLCAASEESPGADGIGVWGERLTRFAAPARVPQMGWNQVEPGPGCALMEPAAMYFANSYRLERGPDGWASATAEHGGRFVAAMERGAVLACQFHPELSGASGLGLLGRWMSRARERGAG